MTNRRLWQEGWRLAALRRRDTVRRLGGGLIGLCLVLAATTALADPQAQVEPAVVDLGNVEEGQSFERVIEITNVGDGVLVLEDVKTSCGCTAVALDGVAELRAGESEKVKVKFNTKNLEGEVAKKITLTTNDPAQKNWVVEIRADVHRPISWDPRRINFKGLDPDSEFSQVVTLRVDRTLDLEVRDAYVLGNGLSGDLSDTAFSVEVSESERSGNHDYVEFTVSLNPDQSPQQVSEVLEVVTNLKAPRDTLRLSIRGELTGRLEVSRNFAILPMVAPGEEAVRQIEVSARQGTFHVLKAEVPDSPVEVSLHPNDENTKVVVELRYVGTEPGANGIKTLRIETDDPDQSLLEIPVRYQTRTAARVRASTSSGTRAEGP